MGKAAPVSEKRDEIVNILARTAAVAVMAAAATTAATAISCAAPADFDPTRDHTVVQVDRQQAPGPDTTAGAALSSASGVSQPVTPQQRQAAIDRAVGATAAAYGGAAGGGQMLGTLLGVGIGCSVGAATAGTLTLVATLGTLTPLAVAGGCVLGGVTLGGLGSALGGAVTGVPALLQTGTQQYNQLRADGVL